MCASWTGCWSVADLAHRASGDTDLVGDRDAGDWAERFIDIRLQVLGERGTDIADDPETMRTWFANAIETGYDLGYGQGRDDEAAGEPTEEG